MNQLIKVLHGEIINPRDGIRVIGQLHAMRNARTDKVYPVGMTVQEIMDDIRRGDESRMPRRFNVTIGPDVIPERLWRQVRPKKNTIVTFKALVEGGGPALKSGLGIALAVASLVLTAFLAPYLTPIIGATAAAVVTALVGAAITVGGSLLLNAMFPTKKPKLNQDQEERPTYSIGGASNTAKPWGTIPMVLGRHRMSPLYASRPYTEIVGNDQYLRVVFCWGYGYLNMTDLRIGETPISRFDEVTLQHRHGTVNDDDIDLFPSQKFEEQFTTELVFGSDTDVGSSPDTTDVSNLIVEFSFPNGLFTIPRQTKLAGLQMEYAVSFDISIRKFGTSSWDTKVSETFRANDKNTIRFGKSVSMSLGRWEVRVRRTSAMFSDSFADVAENLYLIAIRWTRFQHPIQTDEVVALTAIKIKATDQLAGILDTFNGMVALRTKSIEQWHLHHRRNIHPIGSHYSCVARTRQPAAGAVIQDRFSGLPRFCQLLFR